MASTFCVVYFSYSLGAPRDLCKAGGMNSAYCMNYAEMLQNSFWYCNKDTYQIGFPL